MNAYIKYYMGEEMCTITNSALNAENDVPNKSVETKKNKVMSSQAIGTLDVYQWQT